jgi:hypothetical protein
MADLTARLLPARIACIGVLLVAAGCGGSGGSDSSTAPPPVSSPTIPPGLMQIPAASSGTLGVRVFPAAGQTSQWCVFRGWPDEQLHIVSNCNASPRAAPFARAAQGELVLAGVADAGARLWLLTYDAAHNVPSGRNPGVVIEGIDVWLFSAAGAAEPVRIAERVALGGAFDPIYAAATADELTACAIDHCFSVHADTRVEQWTTPAMSAYEFVEAVPAPGAVEAIVRLKDDHVTGNADLVNFHYAWASLHADRAEVRRIDADCLPYSLTLTPGGATWQCARTRAQVADLLRRELDRMPNDGMMDFGASNLEGRIAWSQAYYLDGLARLSGGSLPALGAAADWSALRTRLRAEFNLLAERVLSSGGLASKRYTIERTAVTFALHVGRTAQLLRTGADTGNDSSELERARDFLQTQLRSLNGTVEQPAQAAEAGTTYATLGYARGADFWCDGVNVPYNYISGIVSGMLAADDVPAADVQRAAVLMRPLLSLEQIESAALWRYWWSRGSNGWVAADDVSTNTPDYGGSPGVAHITYRSMDAVALLRLQAADPAAVPADAIANIRSLTVEGGLLPWVNAELPPAQRVTLAPAVAYRYARSTAAWELQAQVWALEQLAQAMSQ